MIHNDVINQLQLLVKTTAPPLVEVAETPAELPHWAAGQRLPAHVLASLPNGRFQVSVGDQVLDMNLPKNTQPGENLVLVFVASQPRLTFVLSRETPLSQKANAGASASLAASNGTAALAAAEDALPLAASGAGARQPVTLSDTARFIGALMQKVAQQQGDDASASSQVKGAAVVAAPPADSRQFALALRGALSQSGLFYESHQAQWVAGERPMAELLREPQGALSLRSSQASQASQAPGIPASAGETQKAQVMVALQPDSAQVQAAAGKGAEMVRPETLPLIQQQLQTLDTHQLVWQGQVWPGQQMDWVVEERDAREQGGADEAAANWNTHLRLTMPNLGAVSATLAFSAQGLRINLAAADPASAEKLKIAQMRLHHSLEAAGLALSGMTVEHDGGA